MENNIFKIYFKVHLGSFYFLTESKKGGKGYG